MNWMQGQNLKDVSKSAVTTEQLKEYATASGDYNPIHLDPQFAQEAGFPSVIVHGMLSMAFLADGLRTNFPEGKYDVVRFKSRFRKVTFPGDTLTVKGQVKAISSEGLLTISLWVENQKGETPTDGEAVVKPLA